MPNERRSSSERYEWYQAIYETPIYPHSQWVTTSCTATAAPPPPRNERYFNIDYTDLERYFEGILGTTKTKERKVTKLGNSLD